MESQARWINDGPDTLELEAVLSGGLHDGIHEDQLEEMGLRGGTVALASRTGRPAAIASIQAAAPTLRSMRPEPKSSPASDAAADWFRQNYPKLKPNDLADYYREKYLKVHVPVRTGTHDGFMQLRNMLAQHVQNSNALDEQSMESRPAKVTVSAPVANPPIKEELALPPQLDLTAYRPETSQRPVRSVAPRTSSIVLMTMGALVLGALVGLGLANPPQMDTLLNPDLSSASVQAWIPALFGK